MRMYKIVIFDKEANRIKDFLSIPAMLYSKRELTLNRLDEENILLEKHILCRYFKQHKILAYDQNDIPCGRCILTVYPDVDTAYVGYFECIDDDTCATLLLKKAEECATAAGYTSITGPLDSSFWLRYRMKVNEFHHPPYFGEPYNKPYYKRMFEDNGYIVIERWVSNIYDKLPLLIKRPELYRQRLYDAQRKNYIIKNVKPAEFDTAMDIIYSLISETFKDFITFSEITKEDFRELFKNHKYILDYHFVKIAYFNQEPVAFSIVLPDYGNLLYGEISPKKKLLALLRRLRAKTYVSLYMGVKQAHRGLGKALTQKIAIELYLRRSECIGALITSGKITESYAEDHIREKRQYVLFRKEVD